MSAKNQHLRLYVFIPIVFLFLLLVHFVVYSALVTMFAVTSRHVILILRIVAILLPVFFIGASVLSAKYNNFTVRTFYKVVMVFLGFFVYLFLASLLYGIIVTISMMAGFVSLYSILGAFLIGIALAASVYGLFHAQKIVVRELNISIPQLPIEWNNRKAVWVSDVHLGHIRGKKFTQKVVNTLNAIEPDIIFIGGDLYDGVMVNESDIIAPLKNLRAPLGTYFITGNHEEFSDSTHFTNAVKEVGIKVLDDELVIIDGLQIIGVNDHDAIDKSKFAEILNHLMIRKEMPTILLKHQPSELGTAEAAGISLQISGHTHRAQMFPLNFVTKLIYKGFDYGLKPFGSMRVLTSSGVGTWGPPMRVLTDGEVVVISFN